jgi:ribosome-binding protein aMBF1 (putative translation factor)
VTMAKLTPQACRAARALLGWGVRDLAKEAEVGVASVARYEAGEPLRDDTVQKMKDAFEANGVEITNGKGTGARLVR